MTASRRAGAPRLIEWTGERCVPWAPDVPVIYEHYHRYLWARRLLAGRRVLDLGSGEGFGAALLAGVASDVVGVDIDAATVEHSRVNYERPGLSFQVGSALDLSVFEDASFGAVVAFEVIEHVRDQERVLAEIDRVLAEDGIVVMSTPDRGAYGAARTEANPFHERELTLAEFRALLESRFKHAALWVQRTITGSYLGPLAGEMPPAPAERADFFLEPVGDEWRVADELAPLYCVAVASRDPLPPIEPSSTLADPSLALLRDGERRQAERMKDALEEAIRTNAARQQAEWEAVLEREVGVRDRDIDTRGAELHALEAELVQARAEAAAVRNELESSQALARRVEESVTWTAFERMRGRLYGAIGESSLLARALSGTLRLAGRLFMRRRSAAGPGEGSPVGEAGVLLELPRDAQPEVSLIVPVYSRADLTLACLRSFRRNNMRVGYEVIVIDDGADAETKAMLARVEGIELIVNRSNIGYLRSVNRAAAAARGRWMVLCNNDIEGTDGWLRALLDCAESADDIGVVTPKYVYPDGSLCEAGGIIWRDGTGANYGRGEDPSLFQYEYRREVDFGSAAALLVRTDLWRELGGYDERYLPMYYEDVDLCFEARERGLRVMYEPRALVVHHEGATAGNDLSAGHKRHQEENRPRFVEKWRHRLESEQLAPGPRNLRVSANRHRGPHVLIVDHCVPMWDRDAGSLRMLAMIRGLIELGARVSLMAENLTAHQPYTGWLQEMGVEVLYGQLDVNAELETIGPRLSAAILSRPHAASRWIHAIREFAPSAVVAYDTVDLHWLREARRVAGDPAVVSALRDPERAAELPASGSKAQALRELELAMMRASDVTLVVTEAERDQVEHDVPGAKTLLLPTIHEVERYVFGPEERSGILFVGGFAHPPNAGAAVRLVKDVMPAVWRERPDTKVTIVGGDPPPEIQALAMPRVEIVGWVENLSPLLDRARVFAAPLQYGAGLNGKITQSLAVGLPVVTTSVGAGGIDGLERCMLVSDDAAGNSEQLLRLLDDDELWRELSAAGQAFIERNCSPRVVTERLGELLGSHDAVAAGRG